MPNSWLVHGFSTRTGGFSKAYGGRSPEPGIYRPGLAPSGGTQPAGVCFGCGREDGSRREEGRTLADRTRCARFIPTSSIASPRIPEKPLAGDGLVTGTPGTLLAVLTADCLPVILADTKRQAVGVFHAGWRGTVNAIVEKGIGEMRKHFGTRPG